MIVAFVESLPRARKAVAIQQKLEYVVLAKINLNRTEVRREDADMASIRKRGNSYLLVVSMGYDHNGKRRLPQQKTVKPPEDLAPK